MLCSISTGKCGSKWLDRLRSSKGFPADDDLDLGQFLNHHNPNVSNSSDTEAADSNTNNIGPKLNLNSSSQLDKLPVLDRSRTPETSNRNESKELVSVLNNVLAELFVMGDVDNFPRINRKKSFRKQPNPRICVASTSTNTDENTCQDDFRREEDNSPTLPSSGDNSRVEINGATDHMKSTEEEEEEEEEYGNVGEEEEKCHADLSKFSKTEVTVIDTSCPSWKFEKLLFRNRNVWKVRDKKSKAINLGKKKRKANVLDDCAEEKKAKVSVGQCSSSMEGNYGEEGPMPPNEVHHQSDEVEEGCKETVAILPQVPTKRLPSKLKKEGSSVVLVKSIPTSKKNGASIGKSCLEATQKLLKA
ncbi:unnamed protein product [Ilex paraguariensis]|uniref:Uncharacterized protein n=1 Tax=Ilex paraguariensis TaxID=185542 RepID=A0ABC8SM24_9AQUA